MNSLQAPGSPLLSVITASRDRHDSLRRKAQALAAQTLPPATFEWCLWLNEPREGVARVQALLAELELPFAVRLDGGESHPVGRARNLAAKGARGRVLLLSDDDCLPDVRALEAHLALHETTQKGAGIGPLRLPTELRKGSRREPFERSATFGMRAPWINFTGANSSLPAELFWSVGGYDSDWTGYGGEDPELALRLRAQGTRFHRVRLGGAVHLGRVWDDPAKAYSAGWAHRRVCERHLAGWWALGIHPWLLGAKRLLLDGPWGFLYDPEVLRYERAYAQGARDAANAPGFVPRDGMESCERRDALCRRVERKSPMVSNRSSAPIDVRALMSDVFEGSTLDRERARSVMGLLMDGELSQMQAAALLAALRTRGETIEEIVGFAEAMRERAVKVTPRVDGPLLDTCGTGGTGFSSINISTTAIFVAAAAGVRIAKHGNRGVTKRSGSADVLETLGVKLEQSPEQLALSIEETGLAFIFARTHHPSMKFVAPIRADLQARTIFNSLGPLTNPAGATRQLMGVFSPTLTGQLAKVLGGLGTERALVVHGDGLDDFSVSGESVVAELMPGGEVREYRVTPEEVGLGRYPRSELEGGDPQENARQLEGVLSGKVTGAKRDVVLFNAGAALYLADEAENLAEGVTRAAELIDSGAATAKLEELISFSRRAA